MKKDLSHSSPLVSVVMPAYNSDMYISAAIESIINQTYHNWELIVVNDCSADQTSNIAERFARQNSKIRIAYNKKNLGVACTMNHGIDLAQGKYVARLDADDWSYPDRLEKQVDFLEKHKDIVLLGGSMNICDGSLNKVDERRYATADEEIRKRILYFNQFCSSAIMVRRSTAIAVGGYENYRCASDYDFVLKVGLKGTIANLNDTLVKYRIHKSSITRTNRKMQAQITLEIQKKFAKNYPISLRWRLFHLTSKTVVFLLPMPLLLFTSGKLQAKKQF